MTHPPIQPATTGQQPSGGIRWDTLAGPQRAQLLQNLQKMRAGGASVGELDQYLRGLGLAPVTGGEPQASERDQWGMMAAQGVSAGTGAKIFAGIDALNAAAPTWIGGEGGGRSAIAPRYAQTRDRLLEAEEQGIASHPVAGRALEFAAGAVPTMVGGWAARAAGEAVPIAATSASRAVRALRGALDGAKMGAVAGASSGAGHATGGVADYAQQIAEGVGMGALFGGAFGGAAGAASRAPIIAPESDGPTANAGGSLLDRLRSVLQREPTQASGRPAPAIETTASPTMGPTPRPAMTVSPRPFATEPQDMEILSALRARGMGLDDAFQTISEWRAQGAKPETLMELLGEPGMRRVRAARTVSPQAAEQINASLEHRAAGAPGRVIEDALETSGLQKRESGFQSTQQFLKQRAAAADAGYGEAFSDATPIEDVRIQEVLATPAGQSGWQRAVRMMRNKGIKVDESPEGLRPTLQQLHYLKLALDDIKRPGIDAGPGAGGMGFHEGMSVAEVQQKLLAAMDEHSDAYRLARQHYSDHSALIDASKQGRDLFKTHPEEAAQQLAELPSADQRDAFRRSAMDALAERLENGPTDVSKGSAGKPRDLARIRLLFPDGAEGDAMFGAFRARVAREVAMVRTGREVMGGSQSIDKLADLADIMGITPMEAVQAASGHVGPAVFGAASRRVSAWAQGMGRSKAAALAPDLVAQGPDAVGEILSRVLRTGRRLDAVHAASAARLQRAAGIGAGAAVGARAATTDYPRDE